MHCKAHVPGQLRTLCAISREAKNAVRGNMIRIDMLEMYGKSELDHLLSQKETKLWSPGRVDIYLVCPRESIIASFVSFKLENDLIKDVWLTDVFLFEKLNDFEKTMRRH